MTKEAARQRLIEAEVAYDDLLTRRKPESLSEQTASLARYIRQLKQ
jgi:hypothetical protein